MKTSESVRPRAWARRRAAERRICIAAVAGVHCRADSLGETRLLLERLRSAGDIVCLCGDLTQRGAATEARVLAQAMREVAGAPVLAVLGSHDYESGEPEVVRSILEDAGIRVLDGDSCVVEGVGFAGTKGFGGGFGSLALPPMGEPVLKAFVREATEERERLASALAELAVPSKIVLLHYAPVSGTLRGEPPEIHPFLGSSLLEEPIDRFACTAVLHGRAHHGGRTSFTTLGVPIFNVSLPVVRDQVDPSAHLLLNLDVEDDVEATLGT